MQRSTFGYIAYICVLLLSSLSAFAQFRTVTVQNANNNPVPTTIQNTPAVTVTNTPNVNVSNTPTVNINGTVPVSGNVGITGTPAVSISGTASVNAANLPLTNNGGTANGAVAFKNVDEAARQPFQVERSFAIAASNSIGGDMFAVPAGQELVIEYVSAKVILPTGQALDLVELGTTAGGSFAHYRFLGVSYPGTNPGSFSYFGVSQPTRIYADPSTTVMISVERNLTTGVSNTVNVTLSGYLVNIP